jgi:hypothetical protein
VEGLFGGFNCRFLLPGLVEAVTVDLLLVLDVGLHDHEELIIGLRTIEVDSLFDDCVFAQTSGDEKLFHVFISTSHLDSFLVEPLDVV